MVKKAILISQKILPVNLNPLLEYFYNLNNFQFSLGCGTVIQLVENREGGKSLKSRFSTAILKPLEIL